MRGTGYVVSLIFAMAAVVSAQEPQVPDGFTIEKAAGYPLLHRPIFAGFDDNGILYVGESNGENLNRDQMLAKKPHWISRLEDTNGDGVFDKSTKFVENITLPQGCLWYRGSLYATCPPSIWKFTDTDNDGKADQREEILTGFGFSGNACDTHGPFLSPTGRLYIVQGRHGHEFKDKNGVVYSKGKAGRIYSCRPDGSDVRVHAGGGFDNPVEVDFTEEGECIGTVNILYRDRGDCLMHWVEGGVYPRDDLADAVAEFKWTGGLLGPIHNLGHVACSGIMRYRGVHFGDAFKNKWFFTEFNTHKVRYAELKRAGSTFTADVHEFLTCDNGDFHPTDVLEDADGSLLVLNTGAWFLNGCPTSRVAKPEIYGGIYRIKKVGGTVVEDPRGKAIDWNQLDADKWPALAEDRRPAVRERAINTLTKHFDSLKDLKDGEEPAELIWVLRLAEDIFVDPIRVEAARSFLTAATRSRSWIAPGLAAITLDDYQEEVDQSLYVLPLRTINDQGDLLSSIEGRTYKSLTSAPLYVRRAAADAIGRRKNMDYLKGQDAFMDSIIVAATADGSFMTNDHAKAVPVLADYLRTPDVDRFLEHAVTYAFIRMNAAKEVTKLLDDESALVRRAAVIALDQMDDSPLTREMVIPLLSSEDTRLQQTALEVIARHPGWGAETLSLLKTWVQEPELSAERAQALRGFLLAQTGDPAVQEFIANVLRDGQTTDAVKSLVWEVLQRSTVAKWPDAWNPLLVAGLQSQDDAITLAALQIISQRSLPGFEPSLRELIANTQRRMQIRADAVSALDTSAHPLGDAELHMLLQTLWGSQYTRNDAISAARAIGNTKWSQPQLLQLTENLWNPQMSVSLPLVVKAFAHSSDAAVGTALVESLLKTPAAENLSPDELASILRRYPESVREQAKPLFQKLGIDPAAQAARLTELSPLLTGGDEKLGRGIFFSKKANCSTCHAVAGEGGRVGPHLTTIGASRSPQDLLEAIVYPSASFVNGYRTYVVATDDGKVHQGLISAESPEAITLRTPDLQEIRVRRDAIEELQEGSVSIMPKGLDTQMTPDELRHLLAYLQSRK